MPRKHTVPAWLLRPESATHYALRHFPTAYYDQQFDEDAEERVAAYSAFARGVSDAGSVVAFRAFDVPLEDVDLMNLGKSWSARLEKAWCYGGGQGKGWGQPGRCQVVVEGIIDASDVDWPYSFESFLMYGSSQYEVAPKAGAQVIITAVFPLRGRRASERDRQLLDPPIIGSVGEATEEWLRR